MELYIFTQIARDPVLQDLLLFREKGDTGAYYRAAHALLRRIANDCPTGDALREAVVCALLDCPDACDLLDAALACGDYLDNDAKAVYNAFFGYDWDAHCRQVGVLPLPRGPEWPDCPPWLSRLVTVSSPVALQQAVTDFFVTYHDREEARFTAFRWREGALQGIRRPEQLRFDQLAGLAHQKEALLRNTDAFLERRPAHNVLLSGGSGAGKSSCVKATLTEFAERGLRLVELPGRDVGQLPQVLQALAGRRCHYIVYIDDLSFEEVDTGYKELKVALEGQVEAGQPHVLIYATSNRRHLVRESWKDRDADEDIHENDTLHEKLSLSERFGLHLYYPVLSQREYFDVVELLLKDAGIQPDEALLKRAAAWALTYNGRSGRTARQFVDDVVSGKS